MTDALWPSWSPIGGVCRKMRLVLPPCNSDTSAMYGVKQSLHVRSNKAHHTCESSESLFITQVGIFKRSGLNSEKVEAFVFSPIRIYFLRLRYFFQMENHYETQRRKRTHIRLCFLSFAKSFCSAPLLHCFAVTEKECDALWYLFHSTFSSLSRSVWLALRVAMIVCISWDFVDCDCIVQGVGGSGLSQETEDTTLRTLCVLHHVNFVL